MCLILQKFQYSTTKSNGGKIPQGPTFKAPTVPEPRPTVPGNLRKPGKPALRLTAVID